MAKQKNNKWNPEYKYETLSGQFKDYVDNLRDFTMVAVSIPMERPTMVMEISNTLDDENPDGNIEMVGNDITKMLSIGVSVRSVQDKDLGIGTQIAYGKAVKLLDHVLYVTHPGMINTKMVQALLEQEAEYFKKEPGMYIKGYNSDKYRYETTGKVANAELSSNKKITVNNSVETSNNFSTIKERLLKEAVV